MTPEAFLELYVRSALAWGWPLEQWLAHLLPLLSREAQLANPKSYRSRT